MTNRPAIINEAVSRSQCSGETVDTAVSWIWFFGSDADGRSTVDQWLVEQGHPLAMQPGTDTDRFRAIVTELAEDIYCQKCKERISSTGACRCDAPKLGKILSC